MTDIGTKEKILKVAHYLFGTKGYDSVSVREISKEAGVNVSAISYHFENKENLFKELITTTHLKMSDTIKSFYESDKDMDTNTLALKIYDYLVENSESLKLSFKMFIVDSHLFPSDIPQEDTFIGPPGGKVIYDCILKEKPDAKEDDVIWAVRTIFTTIIHKTLLICSNCLEHKKMHGVSPEDIKKHISRVVRVALADL